MFKKPNRALTNIPESVFPTDDYDIPMLSLEMQPLKVDIPWDAYGSVGRNYQYSVIHFYEDDWKFEHIVRRPDKIVAKSPSAVVEPNYTTDINYPMAYLLGMTYTKRWLARTWQSYGIPIWVDVNFAPSQEDILLLGVPKGWRYYATRSCANYQEVNESQFQMACKRAGTKDIVFAVIGGGKKVKERCHQKGWIWIPDTWQRIKGVIG